MTAETPTPMPGEQCCAATVEELCAGTLAHYDDISTKACHWNNQVPQAIRFWYLEKPKLERALAAAEQEVKRVQELHTELMKEADRRVDAAEAKLTKEKKDA